MKKLAFSRRHISYGTFMKQSGLDQAEVKRILELESKLGVLSAINYSYPFAGRSRPAFRQPKQQRETERVEFEMNDEELLPITPALLQIETLKKGALERESGVSDILRENHWRRNPLRETTTSDLLDNCDLENVVILRPLLELDVTIKVSRCPVSIEAQFTDIPKRNVSLTQARSVSSIIKVTFPATTSDETIRAHVVNIVDFLKARECWASGIDPVTGCQIRGDLSPVWPLTAAGRVCDFEITEEENSLCLRYTDSSCVPGIVITNAVSSPLIEDLLLLDQLKSGLQKFYDVGLQKGFLTKQGEILNYEMAQSERSSIFDRQLSDQSNPGFNFKRFMKLYRFLIHN